jgi:hypothetical protein
MIKWSFSRSPAGRMTIVIRRLAGLSPVIVALLCNDPDSVLSYRMSGLPLSALSGCHPSISSWSASRQGKFPVTSCFLVKDDPRLKTQGVYSIPCKCSQVFIGQRGCLIDTRAKKHNQHTLLDYPVKSAITGQRIIWDTAYNSKTLVSSPPNPDIWAV